MDAAIKEWRRVQRDGLLARRQTISPEERQLAARTIGVQLGDLVSARGWTTIGLYWPIRQEINLLEWAKAQTIRAGVTLCLPVVVTANTPLEYWRWRQGEPLNRGVWNIPVPATREVITPDVMLAPMVGFDRANYRLGYGGGYFDRTLAAQSPRPVVIGIGYQFSVLDTIFPQPHDIPMDIVLTEQGPHERRNHADRS